MSTEDRKPTRDDFETLHQDRESGARSGSGGGLSSPMVALLALLLAGAGIAAAAGLPRWVRTDEAGLRMQGPSLPGGYAILPEDTFATPNGDTTIYVVTFPAPVPNYPSSIARIKVRYDWSTEPELIELKVNGRLVATKADIDPQQPWVYNWIEPQDSNVAVITVAGDAGDEVTVAAWEEWGSLFTIYGPEWFIKPKQQGGGPKKKTWSDTVQFAAGPEAKPPYYMYIMNGNPDGTEPVDSMRVVLNGQTIISRTDFPEPIGSMVVPVELDTLNTAIVTLVGADSTRVRLKFMASDSTAPHFEITAPLEGAVIGDTVLNVTIEMADTTPMLSGVNNWAFASGASTTYSRDIPLPLEGINELIGHAINGSGLVTWDTVRVTRDTQSPQLTVTTPTEGFATNADSVDVTGTVSDATASGVTANGSSLQVQAGAFSGKVALSTGANVITVIATDAAGNTSTIMRNVTRDVTPPALTVTSPTDNLETEDETLAVTGTATDALAVTVTANGVGLTVQQGGAFSGQITLMNEGANQVIVRAQDAAGNATADTLTVTLEGAELPPDPATVAPELDPTVATNIYDATRFLHEGADSIQRDVEPGAIEERRAAGLRGRVLDRAGDPLPGVRVEIVGHPELGYTRSRADGRYDLTVNGGGPLTVSLRKSGVLPAQRRVDVGWQSYAHVDDVVMVALDTAATAIDFADSLQVARGTVQSDEDGTRQATLLFEEGTEAEMVMPDGSRQPLTSLTVRATEYTVGNAGPRAMPGGLPATSGYTYAVELSADEALGAGAVSVEFDKPVAFYVENFLDFPVGQAVPVAWYNSKAAAWIPAPNGRVIEIVGINGGVADIDIDGDETADDSTALASIGIDPEERARLATLYSQGTALWRVEVTHFTPWDCNWPFGPPTDARAPLLDALRKLKRRCNSLQPGSVIECEEQVVGESVPITGTPFTLNYTSRRAHGYVDGRTLDIPLSGNSLPSSLLRIDLTVDVAGRRFTQSFSTASNQSTTFTWDGDDAYGRSSNGYATAQINVAYVYPAVYYEPAAFEQSFSRLSGVPMSDNEARMEISLHQRWTEHVNTLSPEAQSVSDWTLSEHHAYDPFSRTLERGDGSRRLATSLNSGIETAAGTGVGDCGYWNTTANCQGDGGPATEADLAIPVGLAHGPDGSIYFSEWDGNRVRRIAPNGTISTVAGNGQFCNGHHSAYDSEPCGDDIPATQAALSFPSGIAVAPDGTIYIAETYGFRIRKVTPDGIISTIAGQNVWCQGDPPFTCGDGGPAVDAHLGWYLNGLALGADGTLYISDGGICTVRSIGPDGIITTVAGRPYDCAADPENEDGGPANAAAMLWPDAIEVGPTGVVYVTDDFWVRTIAPDGIIRTIGGTGTACAPAAEPCGEGGPAVDAELSSFIEGMAIDGDGNIFISMSSSDMVRRIDTAGIITTVVGTGVRCAVDTAPCGDHGFARAANLDYPWDMTVDPQGNLYLADTFINRIRRIRPPLAGFTENELAVPSEDGSELYRFTREGRHLETLNALTGARLYAFAYDSIGQLTEIEDADGLLTEIERDGSGIATAIIAPFGQRTELEHDGNGHLARIINPAADTVVIAATAGGLIQSFTDPNGNTSEYDYDARGRLILADDAAGAEKTLVRTDISRGFEVAFTSGEGRTTSYRTQLLTTGSMFMRNTDPAGLISETVRTSSDSTETTSPDGTVVSMAMDGDPRFGTQAPFARSTTVRLPSSLELAMTAGRAVTLDDPADPLSLLTLVDSIVVNGRKYRNGYMQSTRTWTRTSPEGRITTERLDSLGRVVRDSVAGFTPWTYTYDTSGRLIRAEQGARTWEYAYDTLGLLETVTDPLDRVVSYEYDLAGRKTRQVLPDSTEIGFGYDRNGNLTSLTPPGRPVHTFSYTGVNEVASYTAPSLGSGSSTTEYTFDLDRQVTEILRPDSIAVTLAYDSAGRVETVTIPRGSYGYTYSSTTGQLTAVTSPDSVLLGFAYDGSLLERVEWSGAITGSIEYTYDANLRPVSVEVSDSGATTLEYDDDGLLTDVGALTLTRDTANGRITSTALGSLTTTRTHDAFGLPASLSASHQGTPFFHSAFTTDALDRIVRVVEWVAGGDTTVFDYDYDMAGRLVEVLQDSVSVGAYDYDANGNRTGYTGSLGTVGATYDDQDRLLSYGSTSYTWTAAGELATKASGADTTRFEYDALGNLHTVTLPSGTTLRYLLDGMNRRVGRLVNDTLVQGFLYDGALRVAAELDGEGQVISRFQYGARANVPDFMEKGGVTYRLIADAVGSVRLVVNVSSGQVVQRLDYDAFGNVLQDTNPGFQPFGFAGGLLDPATGLVRLGARDYDPLTGRWTSKDPIGFDGGDTNLYAYAGSNPVSRVDVTGLDPDPWWRTFIEIAGSFAAQGVVDPALFVYDLLKFLGCPSWDSAYNLAWAGIAAGTPIPRGANFIVTPRGQIIRIPKGASGPSPTRKPGFQYTDGSGGHGLDPKVTGVRIMDANKNQGPRAIYMNRSGQTVDPGTGTTLPNSHPNAHHYLNRWK